MSKNTAIWITVMVLGIVHLIANKMEIAHIYLAAGFVVAAIDDAIRKMKP